MAPSTHGRDPAYTLLGNESVGDEIAEGFVAPPLNGTSQIGGTIAPMPEIGGHVYRRWSQSLWLGFNFGWSSTNSDFTDKEGIYNQPGFTRLGFSTWYLHMAPVARWQRPTGFARPFALIGPELNFINEHGTAYFTDPDDSVKPADAYDKTHVFPGAVVGTGINFQLTRNGFLGFSVEYHKVASLIANMDYVTPRAQLTVQY